MGHKILIAEDDTVLRDLYIRKFSRTDNDVRTAEDGQKTLDEITKNPPDILLLDINMPILDGGGVLEKLPPKGQRSFPVIILTNYGDLANRTRIEALGVDGFFIKKDMTIKSLVEMVEGLLGEKSA
jgi:CheY-like chemotaxis protein